MRFFAYLLPPIAMLIVTGMIVVAQMQRDSAPSERPEETRAADATIGGQAERVRASVCEGTFHRPSSAAPRAFPPEYTQRRDVEGIVVLAGPEVAPQALDVAERTIHRMFGGNALSDPLAAHGAYVVIYAKSQSVLDLPEFACLAGRFRPGFFDHVCGVADHADYPVATVSELDLQQDASGPCQGLNVLYHELGHLVQNYALGPADYYDVKYFYQDAIDAGLYKRQYAATNANEYFAEGTQAYFLSAQPDGSRDRAWLERYDPNLFELIERNFGR